MRSELDEDLLYDIRTDIQLGDTAEDGTQLRPAIVWFEEPVPMIEAAARVAGIADFFVVIGTSLVVYPAAGLINYAPAAIPKYILDKKIPYASGFANVTNIEKSATEGIKDLTEMLLKLL